MAGIHFGERSLRSLFLLSRLLLAFFLGASLQAGIGQRLRQFLGAGLRFLQRCVLSSNLLSQCRGDFLTSGNLLAERFQLSQAGAELAAAGDEARGGSPRADGERAVLVE